MSRDSSSICPRRRSSSSSPVIEYSPANRSLPRPTPSVSRPPLSWSSVAVSRATFTGRRRDHRPEPDAFGGGGDRRQRDPWIRDREDRLRPAHVIPHEQPVPACSL